MIASTGPIVDLLFEAEAATNGSLNLMLVAGAGTTLATCRHLPGSEACTWSGLIAAALEHIANAPHALAPDERAILREDVIRCKSATDAKTLVDLCDRTSDAFRRAGFDLSLWIFEQLGALDKALKERLKAGTAHTPLLDAIRAWQVSLGAVVATTNYDFLLSVAGCGEPVELFETPLLEQAAPSLEGLLSGAHNVVHLHGRYDREGSAIFSGDQYSSLMALNVAPKSFARELFNETLPIFVGCGAGLADGDLSMLLGERNPGPLKILKRAIVLHRTGDEHMERLLDQWPFSQSCIGIAFGSEHADLVPFLEQARLDLLAKGFRGRRLRKGTLSAESWLRERRARRIAAGAMVPVPPLKLDQEVREVPLRRFHGSLLKPRMPAYELQAIDPALMAPGADAAVHDEAAFDEVPWTTPGELPFSVVLGDGGSGKTALTHLLISRFLVTEPDLVAIHVRVADYFRSHERYLDRADGAADLWQFLLQELCRMPTGAGGAPPILDLESALIAATEQAKVLIVLDGLDEVSRLSDRSAIVAEATRLYERLASAAAAAATPRHNRLVLTSRFSGYRSAPVLHAAAQHLVLSPLRPAQVTRFHASLFAALLSSSPTSGDSLRAKRRAMRREIAVGAHGEAGWIDSPLMAILIAVVFLADGKLPTAREALFDRVLEQGCEFVVDRAPVGGLLTVKQLRLCLEEAAYRIFSLGTQDTLSRTSLRDAFQLLYPEDDAVAIEVKIASATTDQSLLRERGPDRFAFVHRGVLEFLCGCRLQHETSTLADRAREPAWREPASFAAGIALRGVERDKLTETVLAASSIANGYRPLLCLIRGAVYASCLDHDARRAVVRATIAGAADLGLQVTGIEEHRSLQALLRIATRDAELMADFSACLFEVLGDSACSAASRRGALIVCEVLPIFSRRLIAQIDASVSRDASQAVLAERVQRALIRSRLEGGGVEESEPLIPFGTALADAKSPSIIPRLYAWRRALMALSGGIADIGHADLHEVRMALMKLLAAPNERRNVLMFTLAEHLRILALGQQDAVARMRLSKAGRARSLREVVSELKRKPDLDMGIAMYLDAVAEPKLKASDDVPAFDPKLVYRTPRLADEILASLSRGLSLEDFLRLPGLRAKAPDECAVVDAVAGRATAVDAGPALAIATQRVADGAVRSLLAVEVSLSKLSDIELTDLGFIFADAVLDLKLDLEMSARFDIGLSTGRSEYAHRNAREGFARAVTGAELNEADAVYSAMVIVDVLDATKRVGCMIDLGESRVVASGRSTWDWPPLPLPHLHDVNAMTLGEALDILESCPSSISALRRTTLEGLRQISVASDDEAALEINAALALDWGAQAPFDEESRFDAVIWEDRVLGAHKQALAARPSIWKARALTRLLRTSSAEDLEMHEIAIAAQIERCEDPLEKILAYELLADRADPARGQFYAIKAFECLKGAHPFPAPFFRKRTPASLEAPELCSRAYARLSVWLPARQRDQALLSAVGLAGTIAQPWARTALLKALWPYARHSLRAWRLWTQAVEKLPSFHRDFCAGDSGAVLSFLVDEYLADAPELAGGKADSILTYSLLRDARRRLGDALAPWEVLERAEISPTGAEKVRTAFLGSEVPRMSSAGLLSLRAFSEAGMPELAAFVLLRVPRHPPGAAALVGEEAPDIARLVRAANRGMDATSAPAVAAALFGTDQSARALAKTILEPSSPSTTNTDEARRLAAFTSRRASVEGMDALFAFARTVTDSEWRSGPRAHASRYVEQILLETEAQADRLIAAARGGKDVNAARWLLERCVVATPQFIHRLVTVCHPAEEVAVDVLRIVARALRKAPLLGPHLLANSAVNRLWEWLSTHGHLARNVRQERSSEVAQFLAGAVRLDAADMDAAYASFCTIPLLSIDDVIPALTEWGRTYFFEEHADGLQALQDASDSVVQDNRTLATLVSYCAWDARARSTVRKVRELGLQCWAWPILALCAERCPVTLQARMYSAGMFDDLPALSTHAVSWVTRRSAMQLMSLEWQGRPVRVSFDVIEAALRASEDVWQVQEAALAMVGSIRSMDNSALDLLFAAADREGMRALMAFRMINATLNNDRTPPLLRLHAQSLIEKALGSSLGDRLVEHGVVTANAPPRMRLRQVLLHQIFAEV